MKPLFCSDPLQRFACDGLRTLVLGTKDLSEGEYESWKRSHAEAANCIEDREERLDAVYDQIEKGLDLLGATAIEDKLQVSSKTHRHFHLAPQENILCVPTLLICS